MESAINSADRKKKEFKLIQGKSATANTLVQAMHSKNKINDALEK